MGEAKTEIHILLVEDDPDVLEIIRDMVEEAYKFDSIRTASDGMAAKALIELHPINMIISDISMPHMTGIDLLKWLKEKKLGYILTMMLTGQASIENSIHALKYGAFDFLVKPVEYDELQAAINQAVEEIQRRYTLQMNLGKINEVDYQKLLKENTFHLQCIEEGSFLKTSISCLCRNLIKLQQSLKGVEYLTDQMLLTVYRMRLNPSTIDGDLMHDLKGNHDKVAAIFKSPKE